MNRTEEFEKTLKRFFNSVELAPDDSTAIMAIGCENKMSIGVVNKSIEHTVRLADTLLAYGEKLLKEMEAEGHPDPIWIRGRLKVLAEARKVLGFDSPEMLIASEKPN